MWDIESGRNTLINYQPIKTRGNKAVQMALSSDSSLLFVPSGNSISVLLVYNHRFGNSDIHSKQAISMIAEDVYEMFYV